MAKTPDKDRRRASDKRKREAGLVPVYFWVPSLLKDEVKALVAAWLAERIKTGEKK